MNIAQQYLRQLNLIVALLAFVFVAEIASPQADETASTRVKFTTLHSFEGPHPDFGLVQASNGDFYVTGGGGSANCAGGCGTIFKITLSGRATTLYTFCSQSGCPDGDLPQAGLVESTSGDLYGITASGGAIGEYVGGTVFKITPSGRLTTLHTFCIESGCPDGEYPSAGLVLASDGDFYGTTYQGGAYGQGTVFKITPGGMLTTLYSFCSQTGCPDGANPSAPLVQASNGDLYGTTRFGGGIGPYCAIGSCGTIFKISLSGELTTLYDFCSQSDCADGEYPETPLVQATNGDLYGTTHFGGPVCAAVEPGPGCGTIFKITPGGMFTTVYTFCSQSGCLDGVDPSSGLFQANDGNLYGTTPYGGANCDGQVPIGCGTVFRVTPGGMLTTLYSFCSQTGCPDGQFFAGLVQDTNGKFYGTTSAGGANDDGTVFRLSIGLGAFVKTVPTSGKVGAEVNILGNSLIGATSVTFNGIPTAFTVHSASEISTTVPAGATTGAVQVTTGSGILSSNIPFQVP